MNTQSNHPKAGRFSRLVLAFFLALGLVLNVGLPLGLNTTPANAAGNAQVAAPDASEGTLHGEIVGSGAPGTNPAAATSTPAAPVNNPTAAAPTATPPPPLIDPKSVEMCHLVAPGTYSDLNLDVSGVLSGHSSHGGDIIPPFTYSGGTFAGSGWDAAGVATWTNGCIPMPTPASNVMQPAIPSTTNCAYTPAYWTNHLTDWPVLALTIGGLSYTQAQVANILRTPANGDVSLTVFQQLVGVMLSVAHGADSSAVQPTINAASDWLWDYPPNSKPSGTVADKGSAYVTTLSGFTTGVIGPGQCPEDTSNSPALQPALQPGYGKPAAPAATVAPQTNATAKSGKPAATSQVVAPQTNATSRPGTTVQQPTAAAQGSGGSNNGTGEVVKVSICHATASDSNPYEAIVVSIHSVEDAKNTKGHGDHAVNGVWPQKPYGDVIPFYWYRGKEYGGYNLNTPGIAIINNECVVPDTNKQEVTVEPNVPVVTETPIPTPDTTLHVRDNYDVTCQKGPAFDKDGNACSEPWYGSRWLFSSGNGWWKTEDYCMAASQCENKPQATPPPAPKESSDKPPCVATVGPDGLVLNCEDKNNKINTWGLFAETNTSCPNNQVLRSPYPRAMVNVPVTFDLQPQDPNAVRDVQTIRVSPVNLNEFVDEQGNPTKEGYQAGIWRNLVLKMRSGRLEAGTNWLGQQVPPPQWSFNDRSWNTNAQFPQQQGGTQARFVYQTSSAGLDTTYGRAFDMNTKLPSASFNLPAYGVSVESFCGHEWTSNYQIAGRVWQQTGPCYESRLYPDGTTEMVDGTSPIGCDPGYIAQGRWAYEWVDKTTPWTGVNMTQTGEPNTYDIRLRTQSGGTFNGQVFWDDPAGVWVPVVEVQSVLRQECVAKGTCNPSAQP